MKRLLPFMFFVGVVFARAETIVTTKGEKFEQATISRAEPDGLVITHATGVAKVPFQELSKELQDKYHYDAAAAEQFIAAQRTSPMPSPPLPPVQSAANSPAVSESKKPIDATAVQNDTRANQADDAQFDDLRRRYMSKRNFTS